MIEVTDIRSAKGKLSPLQKLIASNGVDKLDKLESMVANTKYVIPDMAPTGTIVVLCGPQGTAKTLITLREVANACARGDVDPQKVIYVNEDDSLMGFINKTRIAEKYGFCMMNTTQTGGGFIESPAELSDALAEMAVRGEASGVVVVLDTMKKFTDPGNKGEFPKWAHKCRQFTMAGGTLIILAHTNKNPDANGKWVFAGVADVIQDVDILYMGYRRSERKDSRQVVVWENEKDRGHVVMEVAYEYELGDKDTPYIDMVNSVRRTDSDNIEPRWHEIKRNKFNAKWKLCKPVIDAVLHDGAVLNKGELTSKVLEADSDLGRDKVRACIDALHTVSYLESKPGDKGALLYSLNDNYKPENYDWDDLPPKYWKADRRGRGEA